MRVKQTARKSTGPPLSQPDPVRSRMQHLLQTKRKSATPSQPGPSQGQGKGKKISFSRGKHLEGVKVKPRHKNGALALKEIKKLQKGHDLLIPRLPFHRLIREITQSVVTARNPDNPNIQYRYQIAALEALQEAAEYYLCRMFEDSYLCTLHAKRVTLFPSDMQLCRRLQHQPGCY